MKLLLLAMLASAASALVAGPLAPMHASRVAASPMMACNGGKGGRGGKSPPADKSRRGKMRRLLWAADSAENVKGILLSSQTESMLLKMNWKVRKSVGLKLNKRAAEFGVEVPKDFGGLNPPKQSTSKFQLKPSITTPTPPHPAAVAALANLRAC